MNCDMCTFWNNLNFTIIIPQHHAVHYIMTNSRYGFCTCTDSITAQFPGMPGILQYSDHLFRDTGDQYEKGFFNPGLDFCYHTGISPGLSPVIHLPFDGVTRNVFSIPTIPTPGIPFFGSSARAIPSISGSSNPRAIIGISSI